MILGFAAPAHATHYDAELNNTDLNQPLGIKRAKKALNVMESGQILRLISTDPGSVNDVDSFAKQTGDELLESSEEGGKYIFRLKKK